MGLFGLGKGSVEKHTKNVLNKHKQSADRFAAMEKLKEIGTDEAWYGLAQRFSYVYDKTIEDEQEKEWVEATLVGAGAPALPALRRYAKSSESLSWPLRVMEKIAGHDRMLEIVDELLGREEPGYTRDPARKLQLIAWLAEWKGATTAEIARRIVPYLADFDEGVRFASVEALSHHPDETSSRVPLLEAMVRTEEESRRIKLRIAEVLAAAGWKLSERKEDVSALIASTLSGFGMQHDALVRRKDK